MPSRKTLKQRARRKEKRRALAQRKSESGGANKRKRMATTHRIHSEQKRKKKQRRGGKYERGKNDIPKDAISRAFKASDWRLALTALELTPNATTVQLNKVISCCCKCGRLEDALKLLELMRNPSKTKFPAPTAVSFSMCVKACGEVGESDRAIGLFEQMIRDGVQLDIVACNAAITACRKSGDVDTALKLLARVPKLGLVPDTVSYNAAIGVCASVGRWREATDLLRQMGVAVPTITSSKSRSSCSDDARPDVKTFTSAICACTKAVGMCTKRAEKSAILEQATNILEAMRRVQSLPASTHAHNALISTCANAGNWKKALFVFNEMAREDRDAKWPNPDAVSVRATLAACCRAVTDSDDNEALASAASLLRRVDSGSVRAEDSSNVPLRPDYQMFRTVIQAGASVDSASAREMVREFEKRLSELNLKEMRAVATFRLNGRRFTSVNGHSWEGAADKKEHLKKIDKMLIESCETLMNRLLTKTAYEVDLRALPHSFARDPTKSMDTKRKSLLFHAEKKALGLLLAHNVRDPCVEVSICMCRDCHSAFKHAAKLYRCKIVCDEVQSSRRHIFGLDGLCSCKDAWR